MVTDWTVLLTNPVVVLLALVIGTLGEVAKRVIKAKEGDTGWRGVYYVTLPAHPIIVGALLGLVPWLPVPEGLTKEGFEFAGRLGTGVLAGVVCKVGYDIIISTAKRVLGQRAATGSIVPPGPGETSERP